MPTKYDLAIIGSGGGAFAAAIRATTLGKSVVMIERGTLGGTCVNTGCVPSKALIAAADARHSAADAADRFPGIATTAGPVDMPALIAGKQALVESLRGEKYADVADSYGWAVRRGDAAFAGTPDAPVLQVAGDDGSTETIEAGHYLVATGSRPWAPPIDGLDQTGYLTSTTAMELTELPESLLVLGGGYVALEQAQLFARLGSQVTVLVRSRLASKEEPEVSRTLQEVFADEGIRVVRRALPTRVSRDAATGQAVVTADVAGGREEFRADQVLVALGRRPVTDGLGLVAGGSGIILNNEMDDFAAKAGALNAYGLVGGEPNSVAPGARPLSSMTPTMVFEGGKLLLVTGSPGGSRILTTVLQVILGLVDFGQNLAEVVTAPRIHHQWRPDVLLVETGISPDTLELLRAKGHKIVVGSTSGSANSVAVTREGLVGAADPRQRGTSAEGE